MSLSMHDDLWNAVEYLSDRMRRLEEKEKWKKQEEKEYIDLDMYCRAIHSAIESLDYFQEREVILVDRYGQEAIDDVGKAWLNLKIAATNERMGFTQEDFQRWEEERRRSEEDDQ